MNVHLLGYGIVACWNPDGSLSWKAPFCNALTNAGANYLGQSALSNQVSAITAWYGGLIGTLTVLAATDTLASHSGWTEFTNYSGNRPAWSVATANQQVSTVTNFSYTITGSGGNVNGFFLCSAASGTSGTLFSTAQFISGFPTTAGQIVTGQYNIAISGA